MSKIKKGIYFENLDGIRAIAFTMVFLCHFFAYVVLNPQTKAEKWIGDVMFSGHTGVNLFFVLSGFLITYLLMAEKEENGKINIRYFYIRRILRIWPLYFLVVVIGFFVYPLLTHQFSIYITKSHLPFYILFLNNFDRIFTTFAGQGNDTLGVLWSIGVEEQFYFFWPLILAFLNKKYYVHVFVSVIVISLLYRYINSDSIGKLYFHTFSVMSDLAVGALLAYHSYFKTRWFKLLETCNRYIILGVYILLFLLLLFLDSWSQLNIFTLVTERLVLSMFFVFIIGEQCFAQQSLFKLKKVKFLGKIGIISYGLYCLHMYTIVLLQKFNIVMNYSDLWGILEVLEIVVIYGVNLLLAYSCYRFFEKKFLNLKDKFITVHAQ